MQEKIRLIDVPELQELLGSKKQIVLLDTREEHEYDTRHIQNALSNQWFQWCSKAPATAKATLFEPGYWGNLDVHSVEKIEEAVGALGITNDSTVVIYSSGVASKGREGRVAWMLLYFGLEQVLILDGGFKGWMESGGEKSHETVAPSPKLFKVAFQENRRIQLEQVKDLLMDGGTHPLLVDTRSPMEFEGRIFDYQPRMGHIPRSVNIWFNKLFAENGRFISKQEFLDLLESEGAAGKIKASYCEVGVRAATFSLLYELATGEVLPVYDGSLMEWANNPDLSVISSCQS